MHQPSQVNVTDLHLHLNSLFKYQRRGWGKKQKDREIWSLSLWLRPENGEWAGKAKRLQ